MNMSDMKRIGGIHFPIKWDPRPSFETDPEISILREIRKTPFPQKHKIKNIQIRHSRNPAISGKDRFSVTVIVDIKMFTTNDMEIMMSKIKQIIIYHAGLRVFTKKVDITHRDYKDMYLENPYTGSLLYPVLMSFTY